MPINFSSAWRKSSWCDTQACVEVVRLDDQVGVRNSRRPRQHLEFGGQAWSAFIAGVRAGDFHRRG